MTDSFSRILLHFGKVQFIYIYIYKVNVFRNCFELKTTCPKVHMHN